MLRPLGRTAGPLLLLAASLLSCARGAGGAGSRDGGGDPVDPPSDLADPPFLPGLVSAVGGPESARVDWFLPPSAPEAAPDAALFVSSSAGTVYDGAPFAEDLAGTTMVLAPLVDDVDVFFGLGVREPGSGDAYAPVGLVLVVRPGAPIYVDAAADPGVADGTTPGTAFDNLRSGLLTALLHGGGNVWVRDGEYAEGSLPVFAGTHVYGGFQDGFDLSARDPRGENTVVRSAAGQRTFDVQGAEPTAVLDGMLLDGGGSATIAVDVSATEIQLRSIEIRDFADRGVRLRNTSSSNTLDIRLSRCNIHGCGADGMSVNGAFDLRVDGSRFDANVQEGMDLDDLLALDGQVAQLHITGSRYAGNGTDGIDVDLAAPVFPQIEGGFFDVEIRGCRFELNGGAGVLMDEDYELAPLWNGRIVVATSLLRANAGPGIRVDADAAATVYLHRLLAVGNGDDGILVSSESHAGLAVVSTSICAGNGGAGLRASFGQVTVVAMHDIFTGNGAGGFLSDTVESSAASCIAHLQPTPWQAVRRVGCIEVDDGLLPTFENAPEGYAAALLRDDVTFTLDRADLAAPGFVAELANDGVARPVQAVDGALVSLETAPEVLLLPALFAQFAPGAEVIEDYTIPLGSPAAGAGMTPPGGPRVDAGVWGSPAAGEPGASELVPVPVLHLLATSPPLSDGIGLTATLRVRFSEALDPTSAALGEVRAVTLSGEELLIDYRVVGDFLVIDPPTGGWGAEQVNLELHRGLRALSGLGLATPAVLPLDPR